MTTTQRIIVGPVIGKVTHCSARVLFEFAESATVTVTLQDTQGTNYECTKSVVAHMFTPFCFTGLKSQNRYAVNVTDIKLPVERSSFSTLSEVTAPSKFIILSCNARLVSDKISDVSNLWSDIAHRVISQSIDYIFHIGDQIYTDNGNDAYERAINLLKNSPTPQWPALVEEIRNILRQEYRLTYSGKFQRDAMANCPNLTIVDDHEIRDDWGWRKEDTDPSTPDGFYGLQARWVYYEYQRQLWDDIDFANVDKIKTDYHYHILNGIGIYFIDYRGKNSWNKVKGDEYQMGKQQMTEFYEIYGNSKTSAFNNCPFSICISGLPVVLFTKKWNHIIPHFVDDYKEQWQYKHFDQQISFLDTLTKWKNSMKNRELLLLGGDVHHSGHTNVYYHNKLAFRQLITSGVAQETPTRWKFLVSRLAQDSGHVLGKGWSFSHHDWENGRNYAIVTYDNKDNQNLVTTQLITVQDEEKPVAKKIVTSNDPWKMPDSSCCNIF